MVFDLNAAKGHRGNQKKCPPPQSERRTPHRYKAPEGLEVPPKCKAWVGALYLGG